MKYQVKKRIKKTLIKGIACLVAQTFFSTQVITADILSPHSPLVEPQKQVRKKATGKTLTIPSKYGYVRTVHPGKDEKFIIHIQDAHCNYDAQSNIARIINDILKDKDLAVSSIELEGASGIIDTTLYTSFPDKDYKETVAGHFLKKGRINGAEYLSIVQDTPLTLHGIEDLGLYFKNLDYFNKTLALQKTVSEKLDILDTVLAKIGETVFSSETREFLKIVSLFESGDTGLTDFIMYLTIMSEKKHVSFSDLENVLNMCALIDVRKNLELSKIEQERNALIGVLSSQLSPDQTAELLSKSLYFRMEKMSALEYFSYLIELSSAKISLDDYKNLTGYVSYLSLFESIHEELLSEEIKDLTERLTASLLQRPVEKKLFRLYKNSAVLRDLFMLDMNRKTLNYYRINKKETNTNVFIDFVTEYGADQEKGLLDTSDLRTLDEQVLIPQEFYHIAEKRDEALLRNALESMKQKDAQTSIVIAGGFHSEGIIQQLSNRGIGYVVISPLISNLEADSPYLSIMRDERSSLEKIVMNSAQTEAKLYAKAHAGYLSTLSSLQDAEELRSLLDNSTVSPEQMDMIKAKLETIDLFSLLFPGLLEVLVSLEGKDAESIRETWRNRFNEMLNREIAQKWSLDKVFAEENKRFIEVDIDSIEEINGSYFIPVIVGETKYGIIIDSKEYNQDPSKILSLIDNGIIYYASFLAEKLQLLSQTQEDEAIGEALAELVEYYDGDIDEAFSFLSNEDYFRQKAVDLGWFAEDVKHKQPEMTRRSPVLRSIGRAFRQIVGATSLGLMILLGMTVSFSVLTGAGCHYITDSDNQVKKVPMSWSSSIKNPLFYDRANEPSANGMNGGTAKVSRDYSAGSKIHDRPVWKTTIKADPTDEASVGWWTTKIKDAKKKGIQLNLRPSNNITGLQIEVRGKNSSGDEATVIYMYGALASNSVGGVNLLPADLTPYFDLAQDISVVVSLNGTQIGGNGEVTLDIDGLKEIPVQNDFPMNWSSSISNPKFYPQATEPSASGMNGATAKVSKEYSTSQQINGRDVWDTEMQTIGNDKDSIAWWTTTIRDTQKNGVQLNVRPDKDLNGINIEVKGVDAQGKSRILVFKYGKIKSGQIGGVDISNAELAKYLDLTENIEIAVTVNGEQIGSSGTVSLAIDGIKEVPTQTKFQPTAWDNAVSQPTFYSYVTEFAYSPDKPDQTSIAPDYADNEWDAELAMNANKSSYAVAGFEIQAGQVKTATTINFNVKTDKDITQAVVEVSGFDKNGKALVLQYPKTALKANTKGGMSISVSDLEAAGMQLNDLLKIGVKVTGDNSGGKITVSLDGVKKVPSQTTFQPTAWSSAVSQPSFYQYSKEFAYSPDKPTQTSIVPDYVNSEWDAVLAMNAYKHSYGVAGFEIQPNQIQAASTISFNVRVNKNISNATIEVSGVDSNGNSLVLQFPKTALSANTEGGVSIPVSVLMKSGMQLNNLIKVGVKITGDQSKGSITVSLDGIKKVPQQTTFQATAWGTAVSVPTFYQYVTEFAYSPDKPTQTSIIPDYANNEWDSILAMNPNQYSYGVAGFEIQPGQVQPGSTIGFNVKVDKNISNAAIEVTGVDGNGNPLILQFPKTALLANNKGGVTISVSDLTKAGMQLNDLIKIGVKVTGDQSAGKIAVSLDGIKKVPAQTKKTVSAWSSTISQPTFYNYVNEFAYSPDKPTQTRISPDYANNEWDAILAMNANKYSYGVAGFEIQPGQIKFGTTIDFNVKVDKNVSTAVIEVSGVDGSSNPIVLSYPKSALTVNIKGGVSIPVSDLTAAGIVLSDQIKIGVKVTGDQSAGKITVSVDGIKKVPFQTKKTVSTWSSAVANPTFYQYVTEFAYSPDKPTQTSIVPDYAQDEWDATLAMNTNAYSYGVAGFEIQPNQIKSGTTLSFNVKLDKNITNATIEVSGVDSSGNPVVLHYPKSALTANVHGGVSIPVADLTNAGIQLSNLVKVGVKVTGDQSKGAITVSLDGVKKVPFQTKKAPSAWSSPLAQPSFYPYVTEFAYSPHKPTQTSVSPDYTNNEWDAVLAMNANKYSYGVAGFEIQPGQIKTGTTVSFNVKTDKNIAHAVIEINGLDASGNPVILSYPKTALTANVQGGVSIPVADLTAAGIQLNELIKVGVKVTGDQSKGTITVSLDGVKKLPKQTQKAPSAWSSTVANPVFYPYVTEFAYSPDKPQQTSIVPDYANNEWDATIAMNANKYSYGVAGFAIQPGQIKSGTSLAFNVKVNKNINSAVIEISGVDSSGNPVLLSYPKSALTASSKGGVSIPVADLITAGITLNDLIKVGVKVTGDQSAGSIQVSLDGIKKVPFQTQKSATAWSSAVASPTYYTYVTEYAYSPDKPQQTSVVPDYANNEWDATLAMNANSYSYGVAGFEIQPGQFQSGTSISFNVSVDKNISTAVVEISGVNSSGQPVVLQYPKKALAANTQRGVSIPVADLTAAGIVLNDQIKVGVKVTGDQSGGKITVSLDGIKKVPAQMTKPSTAWSGAVSNPTIFAAAQPYTYSPDQQTQSTIKADTINNEWDIVLAMNPNKYSYAVGGFAISPVQIPGKTAIDFNITFNKPVSHAVIEVTGYDTKGSPLVFQYPKTAIAANVKKGVSIPVADLVAAGFNLKDQVSIGVKVTGDQSGGKIGVSVQGLKKVPKTPAPLMKKGVSDEEVVRGPLLEEGGLQKGELVLVFKEGVDQEKARMMTEKMRSAVKVLLAVYPNLAEIDMPLSIDRDNNHYAELYTSNHGTLTIGIDEDAVNKFSPETIALLLNHEISHVKDEEIQPEIYSLLEDLLFFYNLNIKEKEAVIQDIGMRRYGRFLMENYGVMLLQQVSAAIAFIHISHLFTEKERGELEKLSPKEIHDTFLQIMLRKQHMKLAELVRERNYVDNALEKIQKVLRGENLHIKRIISKISRTSEQFQVRLGRRSLLNMLKRAVQKLGEDPIGLDRNRPLEKAIDEAIESLASDNLSVWELANKAKAITQMRVKQLQVQTHSKVINEQGVLQMEYELFLVFLQMACFLRSGTVSQGIARKVADNVFGITPLLEISIDDAASLTLSELVEEFQKQRDLEPLASGVAVSLKPYEEDTTSEISEIINVFEALAALRQGEGYLGIQALSFIERHSSMKDVRDLVNVQLSKILQITEDGELLVKEKAVNGLSTEMKEDLSSFYKIVQKMDDLGKQPLYIDFASNGYLEPVRFKKILEAIFEHPEKIKEGIVVDDFYRVSGQGEKVYDGSAVRITLRKNVIGMELLSENDRYAEYYKENQEVLMNQVVEQERAKTMVIGNDAIDLTIDDEGNVTSKSSELRSMIRDALNAAKKLGKPLALNAVFSVIVDNAIDHEVMNKERALEDRILLNILGKDLLDELGANVSKHFSVSLMTEDQASFKRGHLADHILEQIRAKYYAETSFDAKKDVTFVLSKIEAELYGIQDLLHWIIEGRLDMKKLSIIADGLANNGLLSDEMKALIKDIDPEELANINKNRLPVTKDLFEDVEMRIKSDRSVATMA